MGAVKYWVWLSCLNGVSNRSKAAVARHYKDAETAYFAPTGDYAKVPGLTAQESAILETRDISAAEKALSLCRNMGIDIITMQDARYPSRLRDIVDAPVALYVKGRLPDFTKAPAIAVIGTRRASAYGLKMGRSLSYELAKSGACIISMLSDGIDRETAKGCIQAGGCCIGVLGTAHERDNPLYRDIIKTGALISEYAPGTEGKKHFFRERNRIASALCHGVAVVEAPAKSGALLFAAQALEQGREVFALPGNADAPNSVGTNALIKQGAKPVTCGWDLLEEFEYLFPGRLSRTADTVPPPMPETEPVTPAHKATVKDIDKPKREEYIDLRAQLCELNTEQLQIISAIEGEDCHIDEIIEKTGLSTAKVLAQLTILEIKGYVRRSAGRRISLNIKSK